MKKSYEMDMCNGPLLGKILVFTFPLMLSGVLQLLFNAADIVVVGRFSGAHALAAVGSTGALINLLINVFMGLSIGTNVLTAQGYGAKNAEDVSDTVHTSILLSLVSGTILIVVGILFSRPLLELMATPEEVLGQAALYMKIYFIGMPAMMAYNFGAAILRAIGDTKRPLYYLLISGVVNVILNLIFVIIFKMGVAGVATATVISQVISAGMVLKCLMGLDGMCRLDLHKLAIHKDKLLNIARIGLPAGMQGAIFLHLQRADPVLGKLLRSHRHGRKYSRRKPGGLCIYVHELCIPDKLELHQPEHGSRKPPAHEKDLRYLPDSCQLWLAWSSETASFSSASSFSAFTPPTRRSSSTALNRMHLICAPYFLCGLMDVMVGSMRGMGYSFLPMIVSLIGACGLRVVWIFTVFQWHRSLFTLYLSYPITWTITALAHMACWYVVMYKKQPNK